MPIPILMPSLSPTMTEGNLVKWSKNIGDNIKPGDIIAEIETDKATMEIESIEEGKLEKIIFKEGTEGISVNSLIAVLSLPEDSSKDIDNLIKKYVPTKETTEEVKLKQDNLEDNTSELINKEEIREIVESKQEDHVLSTESKENIIPKVISNDIGKDILAANEENKIFASPLARRMAHINKIDLADVKGSGPKGRIVKSDIDKLTNNYSEINSNINVNNKLFKPNKKLKISSMRKTIAKKLSYSKSNVPHFYLTVECSVEKLMTVRNDINIEADPENKISINDFIIKALANALQEVPEANCSWQNDHIIIYGNVDIGVAVAVEEGLYTPIIRNAENLGLQEISSLMKDYIIRAKSNKLSPEEYEGGNFTLSNLGMYGIDSFSAIINPPQSGIITTGAIKKIPLVTDKILNTYVMKCQLSGDHRVIDGVVGAKLLQSFKSFVENPAKMLL